MTQPPPAAAKPAAAPKAASGQIVFMDGISGHAKVAPEWGTKFAQIESEGMSIGRELSRLLMEQSVQQQAEQMPEEALTVEGDVVQPAGTDKRPLQTEAGAIEWEQPLGYLKQARRSFSPSGESAGDRRR